MLLPLSEVCRPLLAKIPFARPLGGLVPGLGLCRCDLVGFERVHRLGVPDTYIQIAQPGGRSEILSMCLSRDRAVRNLDLVESWL